MSDAAQSLVFQGRCWAFLKLENFLGDGRKNEAELTKGCVKLLFCQVLVVIDVVVLEQVEQCALGDVLGQAFLLDNLEWEVSNVLLKRTVLFFFFPPICQNYLLEIPFMFNSLIKANMWSTQSNAVVCVLRHLRLCQVSQGATHTRCWNKTIKLH